MTDHADPDATQRALRPRRADSSPQLKRGTLVDRYIILEKLGEGGMGVVYCAFDPELERKVAIKLMQARPDGSEPGGELLREAQALARLAHPNVIAVHDVGTVPGDRVFVAMELVEGTTLREWLTSKRSWREVVPVLIAAGNGLAAAHRVGLVHHDFKPDNVMVGTDGRVRVMDFGLARLQRGATSSAQNVTSPPAARLTVAGPVVGTPAYMAPELYRGKPADKLTDQFAFGVTIFESLFGVRPYRREDLTPSQAAAKPIVPSDSRVPARIERAVLRAISLDPADRFQAIDALLAELAIDPRASRRRVMIGGGIALTAIASVVGVLLLRGAVSVDRCSGARTKLTGVWDPTARLRMQLAFARTGRGHAAATFGRVAALLDDYADAWAAIHAESCDATARGEQSERLLDLRATCLQRHLSELGALTELLADVPTPEIVDRSIDAVRALPPIAQCRENAALLAAVPMPAELTQRVLVHALLKRLDHVAALTRAGDYVEANAQAEASVAAARALPYLPVRGDAFLTLARAYQDIGKNQEAENLYRDAMQIAGEVHDDDDLATAVIGLIEQMGRTPARLPEALALTPIAQAVIARLSDPQPLLADLELTLASAYQRSGKYDDARKHYELALQHAETRGGDRAYLAPILTDLGAVLESQGHHDEARARSLRALAIMETTLGREHPDLAAPLNNLANTALHQGRSTEAEGYQRRALAIMQRSLAPDHPEVAISLNNLGIIYQDRGDYQGARDLYQRALDIYAKVLGPDDPMVGVGYNNIGEVVLLAGKPDEALSYFQRAIATWSKSLPADHPMYAYALTGSGKCRLVRGDAAEAVKLLEHAHQLRAEVSEDPTLGAETDFALARARWATGHTGRALALARSSLATYRAAGDSAAKQRDEVERWLSAHSQ